MERSYRSRHRDRPRDRPQISPGSGGRPIARHDEPSPSRTSPPSRAQRRTSPAAAVAVAFLLALPTLTAAASGDEDGSDTEGGQGNRIVLLTPSRHISFASSSDPTTGWTDLFPPGGTELLAGFPGNVAVTLAADGARMRLPSHDGIVAPHSDGEPWSVGAESFTFVTDRDRVNAILGGLQLDLAPGSGSCAQVTIQVQQHGRGNVKDSVEATIEGCVAGGTLSLHEGIAVPIGTVPLGGRATPHPGFTLDTTTSEVCVIEAITPPSGEEVLEPFAAQLRLTGVAGDCVVRLRYLDDEGAEFGPQETVTLTLGGVSVAPAGTTAPGASSIVGRVVPEDVAPAVKVVDASGAAVPGVEVRFVVGSGGGSVSPGTTVTGADGVAVVEGWTLGTTAGSNGLSATVGGLAPVLFEVLGVPDVPAGLEFVRGADQVVVAGTTVPAAPAVRLTDMHGNPVTGSEVAFSVAAGGGAVASTSSVTDQDGVTVSGAWTLGLTPGPNLLRAAAVGHGLEVLSATVSATGAENLFVSALRDRTQADDFVTVRGQALSGAWATLVVATDASSSGVCAVRDGSLRIAEEGTLVPFSVVVDLSGTAGRCVVELALRGAVRGADGGADDGAQVGSPDVRRVAFEVQAEAVAALPPPTPSDRQADVDGVELDEQTVVESALVIDPDRASRARISAWVMSYAGDPDDGSEEGGEQDGELLDRVDVWVAAPMTPAGDALLVDGSEELAIEGEGYEPGSAVAVYLFSEPTFLGTATVDASGAFVTSLAVPAHLARDASHTLRLVGFSMRGNAWTVATPVWLAEAERVTQPPDAASPGAARSRRAAPDDLAGLESDEASVPIVAASPAGIARGRAFVGPRLDPPPVGVAANDVPAAEDGAGERRALSSAMDDMELRFLLRSSGIVPGCAVEAMSSSGPLTRSPRVGGAGLVLADISGILPAIVAAVIGTECRSASFGAGASLGVGGLLVVALLRERRRRDEAHATAVATGS